MTCPVAESISKYADEPEQTAAIEILNQLLKTDIAYINDELYDLSMVTDRVNTEAMKEAFQSDVKGDSSAVLQVYLAVILEIMG